MIEKTCEIIDGEYFCDIDVTVDEWKSMLLNQSVFDEKSKVAVKKWYDEASYCATCGYIGQKYGEHSMSANGVINGFAGRVQKELGRFQVCGVGNIAKGTRFIVVMKSKQDSSGKWEWTLRDELIQAIKELNIYCEFKVNNRAEKDVEEIADEKLKEEISETNFTDFKKPTIYIPKPEGKLPLKEIGTKKTYDRNVEKSKRAIINSAFKCEFDNSHITFIRKSDNTPYLEPHHLIPLAFHDKFEYSLDIQANIISLCSHCHNQIHYGQDFEDILKKLFNERKDQLKNAGIIITFEELIKMY